MTCHYPLSSLPLFSRVRHVTKKWWEVLLDTYKLNNKIFTSRSIKFSSTLVAGKQLRVICYDNLRTVLASKWFAANCCLCDDAAVLLGSTTTIVGESLPCARSTSLPSQWEAGDKSTWGDDFLWNLINHDSYDLIADFRISPFTFRQRIPALPNMIDRSLGRHTCQLNGTESNRNPLPVATIGTTSNGYSHINISLVV